MDLKSNNIRTIPVNNDIYMEEHVFSLEIYNRLIFEVDSSKNAMSIYVSIYLLYAFHCNEQLLARDCL